MDLFGEIIQSVFLTEGIATVSGVNDAINNLTPVEIRYTPVDKNNKAVGRRIIYPVAYDFEMFNENRTEGISNRKINNNALKFLDYIRAHGYNGMLYSSKSYLESVWFDIGYPIWLAHYTSKTFSGIT